MEDLARALLGVYFSKPTSASSCQTEGRLDDELARRTSASNVAASCKKPPAATAIDQTAIIATSVVRSMPASFDIASYHRPSLHKFKASTAASGAFATGGMLTVATEGASEILAGERSTEIVAPGWLVLGGEG